MSATKRLRALISFSEMALSDMLALVTMAGKVTEFPAQILMSVQDQTTATQMHHVVTLTDLTPVLVTLDGMDPDSLLKVDAAILMSAMLLLRDLPRDFSTALRLLRDNVPILKDLILASATPVILSLAKNLTARIMMSVLVRLTTIAELILTVKT
jgi:hypothetical protein